MISKGSLVRTPERVDGSDGDVCVVVSDPYPEWSTGQEAIDLLITRSGQVRTYYIHSLRLITQ